MAKPAQKPQAKAPVGLPGDSRSIDEERTAHELSMSQIKAEMDADRVRQDVLERAYVEQVSGGADEGTFQVAVTEDTAEQRAARRAVAHQDSVALVIREMEAMALENPPRPIVKQGPDEASLELIKMEMAKAKKRVVLPSG